MLDTPLYDFELRLGLTRTSRMIYAYVFTRGLPCEKPLDEADAIPDMACDDTGRRQNPMMRFQAERRDRDQRQVEPKRPIAPMVERETQTVDLRQVQDADDRQKRHVKIEQRRDEVAQTERV